MLIDPRESMLGTSIDILLEESIKQSERTAIEPNELVIPLTKEYPTIEMWEMGDIDIWFEGGDDDNDFNSDRLDGNIRPNEIYGSHRWCDPADVLKIDHGNLDTLIALAENMVAEKELIGAGIIITDNKGKFFNPLHPLMAQDALVKGKLPFDEYTIMFYPIQEEHTRERNAAIKEQIKLIMEHVKSSFDPTDYTTQDSDAYREQIINNMANRSYKDKVLMEHMDSNQPAYLVTPVPLMDIIGIIYPYYGIIESTVENNTYRSRNLAPMLSGNVRDGSDIEYAEDLTDIGTHTMFSRTNHGYTCIGKYSPTEWTNLRHMNIMNVQSMYFSEVIPTNYQDWIYYSVKQSIKLLKTLRGDVDDENINAHSQKQEEREENEKDNNQEEVGA